MIGVAEAVESMSTRYQQGQPWVRGAVDVFFKLLTDNHTLIHPSLHARIDAAYQVLTTRRNEVAKTATFIRHAHLKSWAV